MKIYSYTYYLNDKLVKKKMKAPNENLCCVYLRSKNIEVIEINESDTFIDKLSLVNIGRVLKEEELVFILKNLSVLLESGLRVPNALEVIIKQINNKSAKSILLSVYFKVIEGESLSTALKEFKYDFPQILIELIRSGEMTSSLVEVLKSSAVYFENKQKIKKEIFSIFKFPLLYLFLSTVVLIFMLITVFPIYKDLYASLDVELPNFLKIIFNISDFIVNYKIFLILFVTIIITSVVYFLKNDKYKAVFDNFSIKLPIIKRVTKLYYQNYISKTMNQLLSSKLNILEALTLTKPTIKNHIYNDLLDEMINALYTGQTLSVVLENTNILDEIFIKMVSVSEMSGNVSFCFKNLEVYFDQIVFIEIKTLKSRIEPILMMFIYAFVVLLILSVMIPSLSVMSQV